MGLRGFIFAARTWPRLRGTFWQQPDRIPFIWTSPNVGKWRNRRIFQKKKANCKGDELITDHAVSGQSGEGGGDISLECV